MAKRITDPAFFTQPAEELAKALLGKVICHKDNDDFIIKGRILITEAYPYDDDATDASLSDSQNSQYLSGGHIYFCNKRSENYWRFDIVSNKQGVPESVLIRGIDPYGSAPNNALFALGLDKDADGVNLLESTDIWLEDDGVKVTQNPPKPRVNLSKRLSSTCRAKPLNFSVQSLEF